MNHKEIIRRWFIGYVQAIARDDTQIEPSEQDYFQSCISNGWLTVTVHGDVMVTVEGMRVALGLRQEQVWVNYE